MVSKSPVVAIYKGIKYWKYDFRHRGKRFRGWIAPVSTMSKRQAIAEYKRIYANHLIGAKEKPAISASTVFKAYKQYIKTHKPRTYTTYKHACKRFERFFKRLDTITRPDIIKYQKMRLRQKAAGATGRGSSPTAD